MNEDEAFTRAVVDNPGDNTVRLVYADWLDERDDPRGSYLRTLVTGDFVHARELALRLDPVWVARVSAPPNGVCCDFTWDQRGDPIHSTDVDRFESRFGITLPHQYRAFLLNYNGGMIELDLWETPDGTQYSEHCLFNSLARTSGDDPDGSLEYEYAVRRHCVFRGTPREDDMLQVRLRSSMIIGITPARPNWVLLGIGDRNKGGIRSLAQFAVDRVASRRHEPLNFRSLSEYLLSLSRRGILNGALVTHDTVCIRAIGRTRRNKTATARPSANWNSNHEQHAIDRTDLRAVPARAAVPPAAGVRRAASTAAARADPAGVPRRRAAAAAGGRRDRPDPALHEPVDAEHVDRHELLSARVVHDEVQPQAARAARRRCRASPNLHPLQDDDTMPGHAANCSTRCSSILARDRRPAGRVAAAGRRGAGRTDGPARRRRVLPRQGRDAPPQGARPRQRPRHQPRQRRPRRLRGRHRQEQRQRPRRSRRPEGEARRPTRPCS